MNINTTTSYLALAAVLVLGPGCLMSSDSAEPNGELSLTEATRHARTALKVLERSRAAIDLLGLMPSYECGEPRGSFVARAVDGAEAEFACATVAVDATDGTRDRVTITFGSECEVGGYTLAGSAVFTYSGGTDRLELEADFRSLRIDDYPLDAEAGYTACGDSDRVWGAASGVLPGDEEVTYTVQLDVLREAGAPILVPTRWTANGSGQVVARDAVVGVTAHDLVFEGTSPRSGSLTLRVNEHVITVVLDRDGGPLERGATITVDDGEPREVPIL